VSDPAVSRRPRRASGRALDELVSAIVGRQLPGASLVDRAGDASNESAGRAITGVTHDSRQLSEGDLYAGLPGEHAHGAAFAAQAAAAGAVAVLTDVAGRPLAAASGLPVLVVDDARQALGPVASWIYGQPSKQLRIFGVTGTNGKTTTSFLIDAGLRAAGEVTGLIGTIETHVADQVLASVRTTPEASDLQALLATMVEDGVAAVAMEVSSHALALRRVDGTSFDVVGFTNLSQDHLDFHLDLDDYFAAKARLFTPRFSTAGVVNRDDEHGRRLLAAAPIDLVSFSVSGDPDAHWRATQVTTGPAGSRFTVRGPHALEIEMTMALPGLFNVANALAALAMLGVAGFDVEAAARGVAALPGVPGRLEVIDAGQPFSVLVDYAHTPQAVTTLLETLRDTLPAASPESSRRRLLIVLGCGGDRDAAKRPLMGAAAARLADVAVFTSDNPRSEDPEQILHAVESGARAVAAPLARLVVEADRATAIGLALADAAPGDVVVVAGKGHERGQEIGGVIHPFDDRVVARRELARLGYGLRDHGIIS
jgi:UDP-N-acetylmuramoyl-L-alanyl-D-glutamate--2,6-diaminopimelate ligase